MGIEKCDVDEGGRSSGGETEKTKGDDDDDESKLGWSGERVGRGTADSIEPCSILDKTKIF